MSNYIIFGATSYLGQALAQLLSKDKNNKLMLVSRSKKDLFEDILSDDIVEYSGYDLTVSSCIKPLQNEADKLFKESFNVVVSTGSFLNHLPFEATPFDDAIEITRSHYATVHCAALITLPLLKKRGGGRLITFSCNSVKHTYPLMSCFTTGKAAVETLTQCIAHEYAQYKITANCLRLASLKTKEVIESKPYGDGEHYLEVGEVAKIIHSLCETPNMYINASVIDLYEYSASFYGRGYFDRIRKK